ncbi:MAG TPA: MBL fold metallo-hydrolase [Methylomirabilota bacterium]|nr:MBL fold metallo-hydrolase [Methylomirabilota bacterium]
MHFAFLGTAGAIPSPARDTTSLVFVAPEGAMLVDCGGSPVARLRRAGADPLALTHVVITHIHPDHAYGLPALLQNLILLGRQRPLTVRCRPEHVEPLRQVLSVFRLWERPGMFPLDLAGIALEEGARAFVLGPLSVSTTPNDHGSMPNFAVRVDAASGGGRGVVYSSDTAPCDRVVVLARGADTLIHEATFPHRDRGRFGVHSTGREAGEVAARAGVRRLILAHIEADYHDELEALADEAGKAFGGPVEIAQEFVPYPL